MLLTLLLARSTYCDVQNVSGYNTSWWHTVEQGSHAPAHAVSLDGIRFMLCTQGLQLRCWLTWICAHGCAV